MNQNTKITLSIKQIKQLIKEAQSVEARHDAIHFLQSNAKLLRFNFTEDGKFCYISAPAATHNGGWDVLQKCARALGLTVRMFYDEYEPFIYDNKIEIELEEPIEL